MMKKLLILLLLLFSLLGCQSNYQTYEEMSDEAEITGDHTKEEAFEEKAKRAEKFFEWRESCIAQSDLVWACSVPLSKHRPIKDIDAMVREHRRLKYECKCMTRDSLRRMLEQLRL